MKNHFEITRDFLLELDFNITRENPEDGLLVIKKENSGIRNLIIGVAPTILIMEQFIFKINNQ